jgi:hypothetical protein
MPRVGGLLDLRERNGAVGGREHLEEDIGRRLRIGERLLEQAR